MPTDPVARDIIVALCGVLAALGGARAVAVARRRSGRGDTHECVPAADLARMQAKVEELADEVNRLRTWRHDVASNIGAVGMIPSIMRAISEIRDRLAKLEPR